MLEKKSRAKKSPDNIAMKISEILIAKNRSVEPYFHLFSVSPENVAQDPLGRIVGVFSVSDRSESSAYIGNLIASVAKKEYYASTRRSPAESFESALHRTNIALAELVRNGTTGFMGHLHGAFAVISGNEIHFSAAGQAAILLYRDGSLMDISEGLASEDAATHPLKTFVEISSGQLLPGDIVLLATPELFAFLPPKELERNARGLVPDGRFHRFLETAMINVLKGGAAVVVTVTGRTDHAPLSVRKPVRTPQKKAVEAPNAWSDTPFRKAAEKQARIELADIGTTEESHGRADAETPETRADAGTIYVDGETPMSDEEHPFVTGLRWKLEEWSGTFRSGLSSFSESFLSSSERLYHSWSISIGNAIREAGQDGFRSLRRTLTNLSRKAVSGAKKTMRSRRSDAKRKDVMKHVRIPEKEDNPILARALEVTGRRKSVSGHVDGNGGRKKRSDSAVVTAWKITRETVGKAVSAVSLRDIASALPRPGRRELVIAAILAFIVTLSVTGIRRTHRDVKKTDEPAPVVVVEEPEPTFPPADEPEAKAATTETVPIGSADIVAPIYLGGRLFVATRAGILDSATGKSSPPPSDSPVVLATAMNDLGLIFLLTESGELFSYAPSNGVFTKNTFPLPERVELTGLGAYLTYLYLLDGETGTVYRFPRIDGGFDEPKQWTSTGLGTGVSSLAVNGNVYAPSENGILSLSGGKRDERFSLQPTAERLSVTSVCADADDPETFAVLDAPARRLILYSADGRIIRQYFNKAFSDTVSCAMSGGRVSVSSLSSVLSFVADR